MSTTETCCASRHFRCGYLKGNKVSKSEGTRKVESAHHFWKCADFVCQKNIEISPCISKLQLDKVGTFLLRHCRWEMSRSVDRLHHTWTRRDSMLTVSIAVIHSVRRRESDNDDGLIIVSALTSRRHRRTACVTERVFNADRTDYTCGASEHLL